MKGLAIASFVLGIIGFLSSFWFGLGILPSILAVMLGIYPLIKKGNRAMAITGLILGLLGGLISVYIISHPELYLRAMLGLPEKKVYIQRQTTSKLGEGVRVGDLLVTLEFTQITRVYDKGKYYTRRPKDGYKFVVVKATCKNVGTKRSSALISGNDIEVDKGYIYEGSDVYCSNLLPEEEHSDDLVFEILESTSPAKLHTTIGGKRFTVDFSGEEESTEGINNEATPKEITQSEEKKTTQTTPSPEAQEAYMLVTPKTAEEPYTSPPKVSPGYFPQQNLSAFELSTLSNRSLKHASTQSSTTRSGTYKWVDKNGVMHVTNSISSIPPEYREQLEQGANKEQK